MGGGFCLDGPVAYAACGGLLSFSSMMALAEAIGVCCHISAVQHSTLGGQHGDTAAPSGGAGWCSRVSVGQGVRCGFPGML
jgi:hypothetical protein